MSDLESTQVLIEHVQKGSNDALNELCSRYLLRVLAVVRIRLGAKLRRKVESYDIVQDVMIDAFRAVNTFDYATEGAFLHYLTRVVENKIRDEADRWAAKKRDMDKEEAPADSQRSPYFDISQVMGGKSDPTPSELFCQLEDLERLEQAIELLGDESEEYRELILAVKLEGRDYADIAREQGKTPDAVRMKSTRAMAALARILASLEKPRQ